MEGGKEQKKKKEEESVMDGGSAERDGDKESEREDGEAQYSLYFEG